MSFDIVAIGASAGGVTALKSLVSQLRCDLAAAILIVLHLNPNRPSYLAEILARCGPLPAHCPADGDVIEPGHIYVAPPDRHLLVEDDHIRLTCGAKDNRTRPAIDALFQTVAVAYHKRAVGIVLTGVLDDGTAGLAAIKSMGGIAIVQDPKEAQFPDMPQSALNAMSVDYCLPIDGIVQVLNNQERVTMKQEHSGQSPEAIKLEAQMTLKGTGDIVTLNKIGRPSVYTCPECGGVLWQIDDPAVLRFRCHTGHAYSARELLVDQVAGKQEELWTVLRSLEEIEYLAGQLTEGAGGRNPAVDVENYREIAKQTKAHLDEIRRLLLKEGEPIASGVRKYHDPDKADG